MKSSLTAERARVGATVGTVGPHAAAPAADGVVVADRPVGSTAGPERTGEGRTRAAVIKTVLSDGPITAAALAARLGISAAAVRRHLDQLLAEGAIGFREPPARARRGRGRPARSYVLTDIGRDRLPHAYDDLAVQALGYLAATAGPEAVTTFARRRAESVVAPHRAALDAAPDVATKAQILTTALTEAGFAASLQQVGIGRQLCQHHCPVGHVAAAFPQLCEEEMAVFTRELGTYAQRLATIARGDSVCTTFIPLAGSPAAATAGQSATGSAAGPELRERVTAG